MKIKRGPKAPIWRRRLQKVESSEPKLRRIEIIIAACGAVIATASLMTSYLQYKAAEAQSAIAEATLAPQFVLFVNGREGKAEISNDGGPPSNLNITVRSYLSVENLSEKPVVESNSGRRFPLFTVIPVRGYWDRVQQTGSSKGTIVTIQNWVDEEKIDRLVNRIRPAGALLLPRAISIIELTYETPLGTKKTDRFMISRLFPDILPITDAERLRTPYQSDGLQRLAEEWSYPVIIGQLADNELGLAVEARAAQEFLQRRTHRRVDPTVGLPTWRPN